MTISDRLLAIIVFGGIALIVVASVLAPAEAVNSLTFATAAGSGFISGCLWRVIHKRRRARSEIG